MVPQHRENVPTLSTHKKLLRIFAPFAIALTLMVLFLALPIMLQTNGLSVLKRVGEGAWFNPTDVFAQGPDLTKSAVASNTATFAPNNDPTSYVDTGGVITYTLRFTNNGPSPIVGGVPPSNQFDMFDFFPNDIASCLGVQSPFPPPGFTNNGPFCILGVQPFANWTMQSGQVITVGQAVQFTWTVRLPPLLPNGHLITNDNYFASIGGAPIAVGAPQTMIVNAPELVITKTVVPTPTVPVGGPITYLITVTNIGALDALGVVISDVIPANVAFVSSTCGAFAGGVVTSAPQTVPVGASFTCDIQVTAPGPPPFQLVLNSTYGASGTNVHTNSWAIGTPVAIVTTDGTSPISLTKSANVSQAFIGDTITYTFVIDNNGPLTVSNVTLLDPRIGINIPVPVTTSLAPGQSATFTASYTIGLGDFPTVVNTATASATIQGVGIPVGVTATTSVAVSRTFSFSVEKTVDFVKVTTATVGQEVWYDFVLINTGTGPLTITQLVDDHLGNIFVTCFVPNLFIALGPAGSGTDRAECRGALPQPSNVIQYIITNQDLFNASLTNFILTNTVVATATDGTSASDQAAVVLTYTIGLDIEKSAVAENGLPVTNGDLVTYTYTITNIGNTALFTVTVVDDPLGPVLTTTLNPSQTTSGSIVYTVSVSDTFNGAITNTATVTGFLFGAIDIATDTDQLVLTAATTLTGLQIITDPVLFFGLTKVYTAEWPVGFPTTGITYTWDFGGPGSFVGPGPTIFETQTISWTYSTVCPSPQFYTIVLTAENAISVVTATTTVPVFDASLSGTLTISATPRTQVINTPFVTFESDLSNVTSTCPPIFQWDFGNGIGTSSLPDPSYTYSEFDSRPGHYTATLSVSNGSPAGGVVSASILITVTPAITVSKAAVPPSGSDVGAGELITYTVLALNVSGSDADNVTISDTLPSNVSVVSTTLHQVFGPNLIPLLDLSLIPGIISQNGNTLNYGTWDLIVGTGLQATIVVSVSGSAVTSDTITNTATSTYTQQYRQSSASPVTDLVITAGPAVSQVTPSNVVTHHIRQLPALEIAKTAQPQSGSTVAVGDLITYTVVVSNIGFADATGFIISDTVPANTEALAVSGSSTAGIVAVLPAGFPQPAGTVYLFGINDVASPQPLPAGGSITVSMVVRVLSATANTVITNTAHALSVELPVQSSNPVTHFIGTPVVTTTGDVFLPIIMRNFAAEPDLAIISVQAGSNGVQVVVRNVGGGIASPRNSLTGFWVDFYLDPSPLPMKVNDTWDNGFANTGVAWLYTGPDLAPGEEVTLSCVLPPDSGQRCTGTYVENFFGPNEITNYGFPGHVASAPDPIRAHADSACTPQCPDGLGAVVESHEIASGAYNSTSINNFGTGTAVDGTITIVSVTSSVIEESSFDRSNIPSRP